VTDRSTVSTDAAPPTVPEWATPPDPATCELLRNLVQVYAFFADAGRTADVETLFTDDATWDGESLGYGSAAGPAAIAAIVCGHHRPEQPMMHMPGPPLLAAVGDDEVHGKLWCTALRWVDGMPSPVIYFYYDDVLRRGADGTWRFRHRHLYPAAIPR